MRNGTSRIHPAIEFQLRDSWIARADHRTRVILRLKEAGNNSQLPLVNPYCLLLEVDRRCVVPRPCLPRHQSVQLLERLRGVERGTGERRQPSRRAPDAAPSLSVTVHHGAVSGVADRGLTGRWMPVRLPDPAARASAGLPPPADRRRDGAQPGRRGPMLSRLGGRRGMAAQGLPTVWAGGSPGPVGVVRDFPTPAMDADIMMKLTQKSTICQ